MPRLVSLSDAGLALPARALTKVQAEELLDWLEAHGQRDCEVTYRGTGFTVFRRLQNAPPCPSAAPDDPEAV